METQLILLAVAIGLVALNQAYQQPVAPVCRVAVDLPERDKVDTIGFGLPTAAQRADPLYMSYLNYQLGLVTNAPAREGITETGGGVIENEARIDRGGDGMTNAELVESLEALAKVCRENPGMGQPSSAETSWHVFTFWCSVIVTPLCVVGWVLYLTRAARCW